MGYRIVYEKGSVKKVIQARRPCRTQIAIACFLIFLIMVNLFWPEGASVVKTVFLPHFCKSEAEAVEAFLMEVREGSTIVQSLRSFFQIILEHAGF